MRKCEYCGSLVPDDKNKCDACGAWCAQEAEKTAKIPSSAPIVPQSPADNAKNNVGTVSDGKFISNKGVLNSLVIFLVCVFFGMLGLHRFIQGKIFDMDQFLQDLCPRRTGPDPTAFDLGPEFFVFDQLPGVFHCQDHGAGIISFRR